MNSKTSRHPIPWLYRWARPAMAAIASTGIAETTYLTVTKLSGNPLACPGNGCDKVLSSAYSTIAGIPLSLLGFLAYFSILILATAPLLIGHRRAERQQQLDRISWRLLFAQTTAMAAFSSYMMYVMIFKLQAICVYCLGSAFLSLSLLVIVLVGHRWGHLKRLSMTGILIASVVLLGTVGVYANIGQVTKAAPSNPIVLELQVEPSPGIGWKVSTPSGNAELQLARHLTKIGAKLYTAWWCPHCHVQKSLFGKNAYPRLSIVECDPQGKNTQVKVCDAAKVEGFPTWIIKGQRLEGEQLLETLAKVSGYTGSRTFKNVMPKES
jgi:uncharacterized membrane protein